MDFCGPYDKQLAAQHRPTLLTPLLAGWEFRPRPVLSVEHAGWRLLSKMQGWNLPTPIRRDLLSNKWAVVITDIDQTIQFVNPLFERMTGYAYQEAVGRRPTFLQGEQTSLITRDRIKEAIREKKSVSEWVLNYRKDQTPYGCQIMIRPILNRNKEVVNFIAFEEEVPFHETQLDHQV